MASAQIMKERRVYYLDCSYSMIKPNNIWNEVCENLNEAIDNISDETTELMVIPFAFDNKHHHSLSPFRAHATPEGKKKIKAEVRNISISSNTKTYHCDPLSDFYSNRINKNMVTYMFLMTDGKDEDPRHQTVKNLLPQWGNLFGEKNVFGFYVMLDKSAKNAEVEDVISKQKHLWKVETADININLIRLQSQAVFNVKNENYFELPIYGDCKGRLITAKLDKTSLPIHIGKTTIIGNKLRVYIDVEKKSLNQIPEAQNVYVSLFLKVNEKYDFLVTGTVTLKCINKKERSLKITVR